MFDHGIGYLILDFFFGINPLAWAMRFVFGSAVAWYLDPPTGWLGRRRAAIVRRYWLRKANVRALGAMQRGYMDDQAAIWRRYAGMTHVSVEWRDAQFVARSRERRAAHEHALAQIRKAVRDE